MRHVLILLLALAGSLAVPAGAWAPSGGGDGGGGGGENQVVARGEGGTRFAVYEGRVRVTLYRSSPAVKRQVLGRTVKISCDSARRELFWPRYASGMTVRLAAVEPGTTKKCAVRRPSGKVIDYAAVANAE